MAERFMERRSDTRRRAAVDVALALAELNASWGDYDRALEHLSSADELSEGSLDDRTALLREQWVEEALVRPRP
jgi:hypothetical protein